MVSLRSCIALTLIFAGAGLGACGGKQHGGLGGAGLGGSAVGGNGVAGNGGGGTGGSMASDARCFPRVFAA